ncbi:alpha-amylase family glycosyl hydrolase [Savagea serpentis]|nr:alpha-amylase family glycosyl hydrolase [Savagea serpentis]
MKIAMLTFVFVLTFGSFPIHALAMSPEEQSIYDLNVDRFNNGTRDNDKDVDLNDPSAYYGGDFVGVKERLNHIKEMKFTTVILGNVWKSSNFLGENTTSYIEVNEHYGTQEELISLVAKMQDEKLMAVADFPIDQLGDAHPIRKAHETSADGQWTIVDETLVSTMAKEIVASIDKYGWDGIRLTNTQNWDAASLESLIDLIKKEADKLIVMTLEQTEANNVDIFHNESLMQTFHDTFIQFNSGVTLYEQMQNIDRRTQLQVDRIDQLRMTYEMVELRMFPPTRWKTALTALFMLPGVPTVTYGSEIAMNGETVEEGLQMMNFKTEMELKDYIGNLNTLRQESETIRNGEFELLHNEDDFTVFARYSEDEHWIVVINNSDDTKKFSIPKERFGEDKVKLRGVLNQDLIRLTKDDQYNIIQDRERVEVYYVEEDKGYNIPYLIASIMVYAAFILFLYVVLKNSRKKRAANS